MGTRRRATREMLGLSKPEFALLRKLDTPKKIQAFLYRMKQNFEPGGDTCNSVRTVLRVRRAHCIEGAMVAAAALWIHGEPPLLLDMQAVKDFDHVIALFRRNGFWGSISKTNGVGLRGRDPIYRSLRELAMSYFHEYTNKHGRRSLRTYSRPYDLRRMKARDWVTAKEGAWDLIDELEAARHYRMTTPAQTRALSRCDPFLGEAYNQVQYRKPKKRKR